ncbi:hypothetical protein QOZ80_5AG0376600 [Eleusine coracana subsp. coracana]|nr:hypothetical protein QOZ80_5AG0376600 [Eleusine coracana subsp. coracana]
MAMSHPSQRCGRFISFALAICLLIPCCLSSKEVVELLERACHCFDDPSIYAHCAAEFRLNAEGAFHVHKDSVDEYCGGPCLEETKLALQCVEEVAAETFRFSNGASVLAVRQALGTGCGYGPERGTFEIRERKECVSAAGDEYYRHSDHEQQKPVAGRRYYGEGDEQPYQQQGGGDWGEGEGGGHSEEYCYGNGGVMLGWSSGIVLMLVLLVSTAALLLDISVGRC